MHLPHSAFNYQRTSLAQASPEQCEDNQSIAVPHLQNDWLSVNWSPELSSTKTKIFEDFGRDRRTRRKMELMTWFFGLVVILYDLCIGGVYFRNCPAIKLLPSWIICIGIFGVLYMAGSLITLVRYPYGLRRSGRKLMKVFLLIFAIPFISAEVSDIEDPLNEITHPPIEAGGADHTVSIPEAVDPSNRVTGAELPRLIFEETDPTVDFSLELPQSTCGLSDSDWGSFASTDSSEFIPFPPPEGLLWYYYEYKYIIYWLRRKGYLLLFEITCLAFTLASCFMGAYYWPMCPADVYVPKYVFFNGAIGSFSMCVQIMDSLWKIFIRRFSNSKRYFCAFGIGWIGIITTLIEMSEYYTMSYSFHSSEENYCNETFYWFVYYKNIAFGVLMFLTAMIYIPTCNLSYYFDIIW